MKKSRKITIFLVFIKNKLTLLWFCQKKNRLCHLMIIDKKKMKFIENAFLNCQICLGFFFFRKVVPKMWFFCEISKSFANCLTRSKWRSENYVRILFGIAKYLYYFRRYHVKHIYYFSTKIPGLLHIEISYYFLGPYIKYSSEFS